MSDPTPPVRSQSKASRYLIVLILGLLIGVGIRGEKSHRALAAKCIENGLLVLTAGKDTIRMLPPLTISDRELEEGLAILKKTLEEA